MASDQELSLTWFLVHEEVLSKTSTTDVFFNALKIWIERPQVLNRRLLGSYIIQSLLTTKSSDLLAQIFSLIRSEPVLREDLLSLVASYGREINYQNRNVDCVVDVKIRSLLPRESSKFCNVLEMIVQDKYNRSITFIPFEEEQSTNKLRCNIDHAYRVSLVEKENMQSLSLSVADQRAKRNGITCPTAEWLKSFLIPKLHKWMMEDGATFSLGQSLRLISVEKYSKKYEELKQKYKHFVKMWPERTDPYKFVYEDVAIATYLLLLWDNEEKDGDHFRPQTFVDLGCGNGLLVHILNNEGHLGKGIDLRARKVWEFFDGKTVLEVTSLDPSSQTYTDVDWLIGNHSDELTPWIPVIASRSTCKYFVLPCCFHDFYCKFQRARSKDSQYRSYLDYIESIGKTCGFDVEEDVLRIPSTKRVCQIGRSQKYAKEERNLIEDEIFRLLDNARYKEQNEIGNGSKTTAKKSERHDQSTDLESFNAVSSYHHNNTQTDQSEASSCLHHGSTELEQPHVAKQFVPRSNTEPVRNCTKLGKGLLDEIVQKVAMELLSRPAEKQDTIEDKRETNKHWRKGGSMELSEVSELFDQNILRQLRCEAGGIKTVLRNSHQIFKVQGGTVAIRDWRDDSHCTKQGDKKQPGRQKYWKTKLCWFHDNHPDGCPLASEQCSFAHGKQELKTPA